MKNVRKVFVYGSDTQSTAQFMPLLTSGLESAGIVISDLLTGDVDMIVVVGGDGTFLRLLRDHDFPRIPIAGINTGHLGFFMEYMPEGLEDFITDIKTGDYSIHSHRPLQAVVTHSAGAPDVYKGINDVVIRKNASSIVHLDLSIGQNFIERFSGDGLLISTPAGSTSYNYSVGGGIVDPRVSVIQVSPIAPMNTTSYRSFTSDVILPPDMTVKIEPEHRGSSGVVIVDGAEYWYDHLESISVSLISDEIFLVRKTDYSYWNWVAQKFI